jgi:photosystem II stability/assembly factor-like uncharacterized protein
VVYCGTPEVIYKTTDGGKTWTDQSAFEPRPGSKGWRGRGWSGLCTKSFHFHPTDPKRWYFTGMDDGKLWYSEDSGYTWHRPVGEWKHWGGGNQIAFARQRPNLLYAAFGQRGHDGAIGRSDDGGKTWRFFGKKQGLPQDGEATSVWVDPTRPETVYAVFSGDIYRTEDGGEHWHCLTENMKACKITGRSACGIYVASGSGVYHSGDGRRFSLMPGSPKKAKWIELGPSGSKDLYVAAFDPFGSRGGFYLHEKGRWRCLRRESQAVGIVLDPKNPRRIYAITGDQPYHDEVRATGVWLSDDGGATWRQENKGLPFLRIHCIAVNPHDPTIVVVGTEGQGYYVTRKR